MEGSPKVAVVDIDTLSSSSELSKDDGQSGSIEDCKNETRVEQQIVVNNEGSSKTEDNVIKQSLIAPIQMKTLKEMGYETPEFGNFTNPKLKKDMYERLQSMIRENKRPDLTIKIGDTEFRCYSIVLQCYSGAFFDLKKVTHVNLPPERVTPNSFKILYDWMISDTPISVPANDLLSLHDASNFLNINSLMEQSRDYILDRNIMTADKAFLTYLEAKKRNFNFSQQLLEKRIQNFFLTLVAHKEFVKLDLLDICVILNSSNIGVNSELETFMAAIRWLNHDWKARKEYAYKLMECIRFNIVPPWFLTTLQRQDIEEEVRRVVSITRVRQLINEGIAFTSTWLFYVNNPDGFLNFVDQRGLVLPVSRLWIYDNTCCYHHKNSCRNMNSFGYKDFSKYLKQLSKKDRDYWQTLDSSQSGECQCGSSAVGIPDIFKTSLTVLFNFDKKDTRIQGNIEKSNSRKQEETTTSPSSMQDNSSAFSVQEDTSHTSMLDYTSVSSVQEDTTVSSIQHDPSPTNVQEDTLSSSIQEYICPSNMQKDKWQIVEKRYTYVNQMAEDDIPNRSGTEEDMNTNLSCSKQYSDNSVYLYEEKRVLKLTSSQIYHHKQSVDSQDKKKDQQQKLKKTKEMQMLNTEKM